MPSGLKAVSSESPASFREFVGRKPSTPAILKDEALDREVQSAMLPKFGEAVLHVSRSKELMGGRPATQILDHLTIPSGVISTLLQGAYVDLHHGLSEGLVF